MINPFNVVQRLLKLVEDEGYKSVCTITKEEEELAGQLFSVVNNYNFGEVNEYTALEIDEYFMHFFVSYHFCKIYVP